MSGDTVLKPQKVKKSRSKDKQDTNGEHKSKKQVPEGISSQLFHFMGHIQYIRLDQVDHIDGYKVVERKKKKSRKQREEHIEDTTPLDANGELWSTVYHLIDKSNDICITVDGEGPEQTKKKKKSKHRDDDESTAMVVDERELPSEMNVVGLN